MKNSEQCSKKVPPGGAGQVNFLATMNKCPNNSFSNKYIDKYGKKWPWARKMLVDQRTSWKSIVFSSLLRGL